METAAASEKLISYFTKQKEDTSNTASGGKNQRPELISPNDAIAALKAFVTDNQQKIQEGRRSEANFHSTMNSFYSHILDQCQEKI